MANHYYYDNNGQKKGPVRGRDIKQLAMDGVIAPDTLVEMENGQTVKASRIQGLEFQAAAPVPQEQAKDNCGLTLTKRSSAPVPQEQAKEAWFNQCSIARLEMLITLMKADLEDPWWYQIDGKAQQINDTDIANAESLLVKKEAAQTEAEKFKKKWFENVTLEDLQEIIPKMKRRPLDERWYKLGGESRQITDDDLITADAVLAKKRLETTLYNLGTKAVEWEIGTERFPDQYERCTLCTEKNRVETLYKYGKLIFASHLVDHNPDVAGIVNALWTALDKIAADCDLPKPSRKKPEAALQMVAKCRWRDQDNIIQNRTDVEFHQAVYKARASGLTYESDTVGLVEGLRLLGEAAFNKKIGAEQFPEQYPQDWLISESGQKDVHEEYGKLIFKSHAFDDEPAVAAEIQDVQRVLSDIRNPVDNVADNLADNDEPAVAAEIQADKIPSLTVGNVADNDKQNAVSERKGKNNVWALGIGGSTVWFIIAVIYVIVKVFFFRK